MTSAQTATTQKYGHSRGVLSGLDAVGPTVDQAATSVGVPGLVPKLTVCPKCGKPAWAPYVMTVKGKYGQVYEYQVYRHPDGRRRTPRKCTVRVKDS